MSTMNTLDIIEVPLKEGISLIEASAGTGKTFSIANLFLRLLLEKKFQLRNILVVTFTDAAAEELKTRIRDNINDALNYAESGVIENDKEILRNIVDKYAALYDSNAVQELLRSAIVHFDEAAIFTIHSFCKRTLQENSFESMSLFNFELITDQDDFITETVNDFWREQMVFAEPLIAAAAKNNNLKISELMKFSRSVLNRARVNFMPESVDFHKEDFISLYRKISLLWDSSKAEITALINDRVAAKDISTKSKVTETEESLLLTDSPTEGKLKLIEKLSRSAIQAAILKKAKSPAPEHKFFNLCEDFIQLEKKFAIHLKIDFARYLKKELKNKKRIKNVQSFDDLLNDLLDTIESPEGRALIDTVQNKFKAVMIDEFQDTDPVQYEIFRKLFFNEKTILFFIGDPKQSIYEFRGADIFSYINASLDTPGESRFTLSTNWRSESGMVEAVNSVFGNSENPFVIKNAIPYVPSRAAENSKGNRNPLRLAGESAENLIIFSIKDPEKDASETLSKDFSEKKAIDFTVNEISKLLRMASQSEAYLGDRPLMPSDIAILVINHQQSKDMKAALDALLIPAVIQKSGSVFDSEEAVELRKFMAAVESPKNSAFVNAALTGGIIGCNGSTIRNFLEDEAMFQDYEKHLENFVRYNELWSSRNFMTMFRQFMADYEVKKRLIQFPDGDRKLTNTLHLTELIHKHEAEGETGMNGTLSWYCNKLAEPGVEEEHEQRLEKDEKAVQIMTVFKSKGLEYPLVFCPFMWHKTASLKKVSESVYHQDGKAYFNLLDYDLLPDQEIAESIFTENLSAFLRLFYVALTRSKNRCYITAGKIGQANNINLFDYLFADIKNSDTVSEITKSFHNETSSTELMDIIRKKFSTDNNILISEGISEKEPEPFINTAESNIEELTQKKFSSRINSSKGITSFSNLISSAEHKTETAAENDESAASVTAAEDIKLSDVAGTFFAFPAGPGPGSCLHRIIEMADFKNSDFSALIKENLALHGIFENETTKENTSYIASADIMLKNLFSTALNDGEIEFSLNQTIKEDRLSELEFYYPTKQLTSKAMAAVFKTMPGFPADSKFPEKIGKLEFRPLSGFMHGFIDLVFRHEGKYYIIDWKSNNLGLTYADYQKDSLQKSMENSFYILQYYIYTCALNKYLKSKISDYDYNQFFGGVFYIYLRGVNPEIKGNGIFFDKPDCQAIEALSSLFGI